MVSRQPRGFTLIEALVALLVLSIGLLGLAAMQIKALQGAHHSYQRSVATIAAQDMVERLWVEVGKGVPNSNGILECPEPALVTSDWYSTWQEYLPTLVDPDENNLVLKSDCKYTITVKWEDDRFFVEFGENDAQLVYVTRIFGG